MLILELPGFPTVPADMTGLCLSLLGRGWFYLCGEKGKEWQTPRGPELISGELALISAVQGR